MIKQKNVFLFFPVFFLFVSLFLTPHRAFSASEIGQGATILIYHRFGEDKYPTTNVSSERFREQLAYLLINNYQLVSLTDLVSRIRNQQSIDRSVVITIDDAYKSVYEEAWPILQSFAVPFTVFVYVKAVEEGYPDYMSWKQIQELHAAGVDFQDHGYAHLHLADRPHGMDEKGYRSLVSADLTRSSGIMLKRLGSRPAFLALPYGEYTDVVIEEAKNVGYEAVFTQDPGSVSLETDLFLVPREPILGNDWSTMDHFEKIIERVDLPLADRKPSLQPLQEPLVPVFGARLLYPERYVPGSLGVYVSEFGWQQGRLCDDFLSISNTASLTRKYNRIFISAKEKDSGRLAVRSWLIRLD